MSSNRILLTRLIIFLLAVTLFLAGCTSVTPLTTEPESPINAAVIDAISAEAPALEVQPVVVPELVPVPDQEPAPEQESIDEPTPAIDPELTNEPVTEVPEVFFDPSTVSAEVKETTFSDVKKLIQNLNNIIQKKDYELWTMNLTADYLSYWSDPETLARLSESLVLKRQNITLSTLHDYFIYVVYPSRQNDRVDDIEFIGETRIKAIIINPKGERLVLYNLEKIGDTWKIANWR